ncbi:MAG: hypothetical protein LAP87_04815 [Acidobacteriia bacterium]|nr:hypothetical protein [Terriglobia bacterium]
MKLSLAALFLPGLCLAAIWPENIGPYRRTATTAPALADRPVWNEYGLKEAETASYENGASGFTATAYRLNDTTGALAAFDWQRPAKSTASNAAPLAAETAAGLMLVHGNYLLSFAGYKPGRPDLDAVTESLRNVDTTSLPALAGYLPSRALVPNSERYITGPASLEKFDPGIPPSVAAFHFGAEAQMGVFHSSKGDMTLAVFNYPTPQIAMQRVADFEKLPGAVAKRSGPLVAVVFSPPDPDFAERLLGEVRYQAEVTRDERVPTRRDNIGDLVINAFVLIGILLVFSLASGLALGGFRAVLRYARKGQEPEAMITLHLERR